MLLDVAQTDEGWRYSLKLITLEALGQFDPSWISHDDIDAAIAAHRASDVQLPDPEGFREACARRIEEALDCKLTSRSSVLFSSSEEDISVIVLVSKEYRSPSRYWFSFYPSQKERMAEWRRDT